MQCFRTLERVIERLNKIERDLKYLETCYSYNVIPKFLRLKLHRRSLERSPSCTAWQNELLRKEIQHKSREQQKKERFCNESKTQLTTAVGRLDAACLKLWLSRKQCIINQRLDSVQARKLYHLGVSPLSQKLDVNRVVFKHANYNLSADEKRILLLGLDFGLPITKLNYFKYFLEFENVHQLLETVPIYCYIDNAKEHFLSQLRSIANKFYNNFKFCPYSSPLFTKKDFNTLHHLRKQDHLHITKPDKGNGVVLMKKEDYHNKILAILNDTSKFSEIEHDERKLVLKLEDKLNNVLRSLKLAGVITQSLYNSCFTSGSRLGHLYGLPKVHRAI